MFLVSTEGLLSALKPFDWENSLSLDVTRTLSSDIILGRNLGFLMSAVS